MTNYNDIHISGSGRASGGRFNSVHISGSGKLQGAVECESFQVSGAGKVEEGGLTVHGPLFCSGAAKIEGPLAAGSGKVSGSLDVEGDAAFGEGTELTVSGSIKVEGSLRAGKLSVSGVCKTEGDVSGTEITVSGVLKTPADVQAEKFQSSGALSIDGLLNAETVEIELNGDNAVGSIGGGRVLARNKPRGFSLFGRQKRNCLKTELIEADEIDLENTDCRTVRGVNVHIGAECVIDRVEYSGTLTTAPDAQIGEKVKI